MTATIACIGGGGFLMDDLRLVQERWILSLVPEERRARPRVLFLGTAGGDAIVSQLKAYKTFTRLGCDIGFPGSEVAAAGGLGLGKSRHGRAGQGRAEKGRKVTHSARTPRKSRPL